MADSKEKLFSGFPTVTSQEWKDRIVADLKGADFDKKLVWRTNEGFSVQPFYRKEDLAGLKTPDSLPGEFPYVRGTKKNDNTWLIRQEIEVNDAKEANAKALDILNRGVDSLGFRVKASQLSAEFIQTLLNDICLECVEVNFTTCHKHMVELAKLLVAYFQEKGYKAEAIRGSINYDPLSKMLRKGKDLSTFVATAKELIGVLAPYSHFRCINVNSVLLNNAGAYIYQELGYALAWGSEYLNQLVEAGFSVEEAARKIRFNMGISSNYFLEIAKFRAARMLWANIVKEYAETAGKPTCECAYKMAIHAATSEFNLTVFDAHVNMLRTQTEAMSAAIAGIDSMTVSPFDVTYTTPNEFSERIARNQQLLLKEESHLDRIVDPAAGSYYIEHLTDAIAQQAWALFLQVEEEGGMLKAIQNGTVQDTVNASNTARHKAVSSRREILLGTNQYPNFTELAGEKNPVDADCGCSSHSGDAPYKTINTSRAASEFEALRLQTERSGKRPKAFMLTIGNLAMRQARAQFSCNFLACAGYEVVDNLGFPTVEEGVEAAMKAKADIVVLCSSDDEYAEYAVPAFKAVNGRAMFIVAGAPACAEELKAEGITNFIHVKVNVLDTLKEYNQQLGIK